MQENVAEKTFWSSIRNGIIIVFACLILAVNGLGAYEIAKANGYIETEKEVEVVTKREMSPVVRAEISNLIRTMSFSSLKQMDLNDELTDETLEIIAGRVIESLDDYSKMSSVTEMQLKLLIKQLISDVNLNVDVELSEETKNTLVDYVTLAENDVYEEISGRIEKGLISIKYDLSKDTVDDLASQIAKNYDINQMIESYIKNYGLGYTKEQINSMVVAEMEAEIEDGTIASGKIIKAMQGELKRSISTASADMMERVDNEAQETTIKQTSLDTFKTDNQSKLKHIDDTILAMQNPYYYKPIFLEDSKPVGTFYITMTEDNPADLFGGIWTKVEGRFILGVGEGFKYPNRTGGSAIISIKEENLPLIDGIITAGAGIGAATTVEINNTTSVQFSTAFMSLIDGTGTIRSYNQKDKVYAVVETVDDNIDNLFNSTNADDKVTIDVLTGLTDDTPAYVDNGTLQSFNILNEYVAVNMWRRVK